MLGSEYCKAHTMHSLLADEARRRSQKVRSVGDALIAGVFGIGAMLTDEQQRAKLAQQAYLISQMRKAQKAAREQQAQKTLNPFSVLRLDPQTATEADVRRVQRKLAEIYHGDKAEGGVAGDAMREVNDAAAAAIEYIKARKK